MWNVGMSVTSSLYVMVAGITSMDKMLHTDQGESVTAEVKGWQQI